MVPTLVPVPVATAVPGAVGNGSDGDADAGAAWATARPGMTKMAIAKMRNNLLFMDMLHSLGKLSFRNLLRSLPRPTLDCASKTDRGNLIPSGGLPELL